MGRRLSLLFALCLVAATGCRSPQPPAPAAPDVPSPAPAAATAAPASGATAWWNDTVFYEIFVRSFADSTTGPLANDGIGDFAGLVEKLDYLNDGDPATTRDLGITGIWLMPINPSPSYHGYDVTDYYGIHPEYGTRADFERFLAECHRRGVRVIVDLVLNHSSSRHPWFAKALAGDPGYRDRYIFVDDANAVPDVRGPWGQQVWQEAHGQHYYGIFWSGMPDLNYRNPAVTDEAYRIAEYWLRDLRVDGFRLDAIRHLIEDGDVMNDTPATLEWLRGFRAHVKQVQPDAMMVGEVWTTTEIVRDYIDGGSLDLAFEFDVAKAILQAIKSGRRDELAYALDNAWSAYPGQRFATFVTNHDQDRIASELGEDPARLKLAASLLLAAPGVPFLYYGEEIGQVGRKPDEMIRNPMPWTAGTNGGFTRAARPWEPLQGGHERRNVAAQADDPASVLTHYRQWIHLRHREPALRRGTFELVDLGRDDAIAWQRRADGRTLTFIANLSREPIAGLALPATVHGSVAVDRLSGEAVAARTPFTLAPYGTRLFASAR
ncbi:MAG TPA: alpha-amylase family glycosyl hydrolase [Steroidobacteraceae bacterium]|nr:alpha-amylase family glycosyl hydrolase [Steroidobacteraceae bacterium]